jgi:hypothetical protein
MLSALEQLPDDVLLDVLGLLPPKSLNCVSKTSSYLRKFTAREAGHLWASVLQATFPVSGDLTIWHRAFPDLIGHKLPAEALCGKFHGICTIYGSIGYRMIRVWHGLLQFLSRHAQPIFRSLKQGVSLHELEMVRERYKVPYEVCAMYAICGGQIYFENDVPKAGNRWTVGIFGSSLVYHDEISSALLSFDSLGEIQEYHAKGGSDIGFISSHGERNGNNPRFPISVNWGGVRYKLMFVDSQSHLFFDCHHGMKNGIEAVVYNRLVRGPYHPHEVTFIEPKHAHDPRIEDTIVPDLGYESLPIPPLVHWLECYLGELQAGTFEYRQVGGIEGDMASSMIWKFPCRAPGMVRAVTSGVEVSVAPMICTHCIPENASKALVWSYHVRMRLLSVDEQSELLGRTTLEQQGGPLEKIQLLSRHWYLWSPDDAGGPQETEGTCHAFTQCVASLFCPIAISLLMGFSIPFVSNSCVFSADEEQNKITLKIDNF